MRCLSVTLTALATSLVIASAAGPTECIAFDIYCNLFAFGFHGREIITVGGRSLVGRRGVRRTSQRVVVRVSIFCFFAANHLFSSFDQVNFQCVLSQVCISLTVCQRCTRSDFEKQYTNAIYVVNGNSKNPSTIYIYDATQQNPGLPELRRQSALWRRPPIRSHQRRCNPRS